MMLKLDNGEMVVLGFESPEDPVLDVRKPYVRISENEMDLHEAVDHLREILLDETAATNLAVQSLRRFIETIRIGKRKDFTDPKLDWFLSDENLQIPTAEADAETYTYGPTIMNGRDLAVFGGYLYRSLAVVEPPDPRWSLAQELRNNPQTV